MQPICGQRPGKTAVAECRVVIVVENARIDYPAAGDELADKGLRLACIIQSCKVENIRTGNARNGKQRAVLLGKVAAAGGCLQSIRRFVDQKTVIGRSEHDPEVDRGLPEDKAN